MATGCFEGAAALGLPCEQDGDCGLDQKCIEGVCGGPTAAETTGTTTGTSSESSGETGTPEGCVDPPQCIPEVPGFPDADCNGNCTNPVCGDGLLNDQAINTALDDGSTEQCDEGSQGTRIDTATCDDDCTVPLCGDNHFNAAAVDIEACDDGNDSDLDDCTAACRIPVFVETFDAAPAGWTVEPYDLQAAYEDEVFEPPEPDWWPLVVPPEGVTDIGGWRWAEGAFDSGGVPYHDAIQTLQYGYAGVTRLVSPMVMLPSPASGFGLQLRFAHTLEVEPLGCATDASVLGDGGRVWIREGTENTLLVPATRGAYEPLEDRCSGASPAFIEPNPMVATEGGLAFTGASQTEPAEVFDLTPFADGRQVQIVFEFGTDCEFCKAPLGERESSRWRIDDVVISEFPE